MLEKKIPKTLDDCYKMNGLVKSLYNVADIIKMVGKVLMIIIGVLTVLSFFVLICTSSYLIGAAFGVLLAGAIAIGSIFISAYLLSIGFRALASIVLHTRISANVALYTAKLAEDNANNQTTTAP